MIIELDVIHNDDDAIQLEELGIESSEENTYLVKWTFFKIDYCVERKKNKNHSIIGVGDNEFITPVPYKKLVEMIKATQ